MNTGTLPPLVGDDVELVQSLLVAPEGQASKELLDGGVPRPDGQEDQVALVIADAGVGHHVRAFVDAVQRGRSVCGAWWCPRMNGNSTARWGKYCPRGWKKTAQSGSNCRVCGLK
jgi:hypothetical protein